MTSQKKDREIPDAVLQLIDHYFNLDIRGTKVRTPYYRNVKHARAELRSLVGKGTPEEIEDEVKVYSQLKGYSLRGKTPGQIREFMSLQGLGVDCSGFAAHVYDTWLRSTKRGPLYRNIKFPPSGIYRKLVRFLRPIENCRSDLLTGPLNAYEIALADARPGDMIRLKGLKHGHHVAIITNVDPGKDGKPEKIKYVHSSPYYGKQNGMRYGEIIITDPQKDLRDQKWTEVDADNVCWTYKQLLKEHGDNGIRRPMFFGRKS